MITLREAGPEDLDEVLALHHELERYNIDLGQRRPRRWEQDPVGFARSHFGIALADPTVHHVVFAERDGGIVGLCYTELKGDGNPCPAHVHTLVVHDPFRGQGIGHRLLDEAFAWSSEQGADEVSLHVASVSAASRRFYAHFGFDEVNVLLAKAVSSK